MVHQVYFLNPGIDGLLFSQDTLQEQFIPLGLDQAHGFQDQFFLAVLNEIDIGFAHIWVVK